MEIEVNELECRRFNIVSGRLVAESASMEAINKTARKLGVQLLTTRVPVDNLSRVHQLEEAGFQLMDTLVYYTCDLFKPFKSEKNASEIIVRLATPSDANRAADLAMKGFNGYFGHYHADPKLDNKAADQAYVEWAQTSLAQVSDDAPVLLAELDAHVVAFLTLRKNSNEEMELILSAVDTSFHSRGLYSALIAKSLEHAKAAGMKQVLTSTQINNYAVQRVWTRLGFTHTRSLYTFHKWFDF